MKERKVETVVSNSDEVNQNGNALISEIIKKGQEEAKAIISEAELKAEAIQKEILAEAKAQAEKITSNAKISKESRLNQQKLMFDLDKRQAFLVAKTEILDAIFNGVYESLKNLDGKKLEDLVIKMIKRETYEGSETIKCSKTDYKKYEALLPKINKALNTNFLLSKDSISIDSGFMIIGKDYDLNFDFYELVNLIRKQTEKELAERLFKK